MNKMNINNSLTLSPGGATLPADSREVDRESRCRWQKSGAKLTNWKTEDDLFAQTRVAQPNTELAFIELFLFCFFSPWHWLYLTDFQICHWLPKIKIKTKALPFQRIRAPWIERHLNHKSAKLCHSSEWPKQGRKTFQVQQTEASTVLLRRRDLM